MIQYAVSARGVPSAARLRTWARAVLGRRRAELTVRIVGGAESRALNKRWRGKDQATNVLSFPYAVTTRSAPSPESRVPNPALHGDIVLCAPVIAREAKQQRKPPSAHWAHMVVHGVLHLLGHDHRRSHEALTMEAKERALLAALSFPDPYLSPRSRNA